MKKRNNKVRHEGYSLIELLLVIAFIAGALVLAFVTYPKVQATSRANLESQHLSVLSTEIKNLYASAKSFSTLSNAVALNAKIIPDDMRVDGVAIKNVWEGDVIIETSPTPNKYQITYGMVPAAECAKIATGVAVNFMALTIGGAGIFNRSDPGASGNDSGGTVNIDPEMVTRACHTAPNGNTMVFTGN